ncbi:unnamed protein product [marine sediment metagenome]|uniref:Uncharacterized protein n=1 Tax=marine sediment metagenome TaxID=412755 RepID=X1TN13_9ZZZZ
MACAIVTNWGNIIRWTTPNQSDISYVEVYRRIDAVTASITTADIVGKVPNVPNTEQAFPYFYDLFTAVNTRTDYWYWAKSVAYDGQRSTGSHPTITADRSTLYNIVQGFDTLRITVATAAPAAPSVDDLWVDTTNI